MQTASTAEIDDVDYALGEILEQLDLEALGKNSVGVLLCYYEFIETGIVNALSERLPFDVIGMTTMASASGSDCGMYRLCLCVLSSDDVSFEIAVTPPISLGNYESEIETAYRRARGKLPGDPSFIISFFPFLRDVSAAELLKSFDKTCGSVPIWGSVSGDMDTSYEHCRTLWNAEADIATLAMLLVHGPIEPKFVLTSIPERNMRDSSAIITKSEGCVIKEVNGMRFDKYVKSVGLVLRGTEESSTIPLLINYGGGSKPVALAIYDMRDDGTALCGGEIPQGSVLIIGQVDYDGIIETTGASMDTLMAQEGKNGLLLLPCVSRYIMLAPRQEDEMRAILRTVDGKIPFIMGYSGGEICPVLENDGKYHNRHHNFTFSACLF
ncbi:MAG: FIST C-terminal domain-containing protein [Synergistaceae bacterium]|jgi:hypothetical protein|nr:FIST C-terminal domain-containing protein [Synergistaceae bacterium]